MEFVNLSLIITFVVFIIFVIFNKRDKSLQRRIRNSLIDSITFNAGLILFLYMVGEIFSIGYISQINEDLNLFAILIASMVLMSHAGDKYYISIKKLFKRKNLPDEG